MKIGIVISFISVTIAVISYFSAQHHKQLSVEILKKNDSISTSLEYVKLKNDSLLDLFGNISTEFDRSRQLTISDMTVILDSIRRSQDDKEIIKKFSTEERSQPLQVRETELMDCAENGTGNYCFTNSYSNTIDLIMKKGGSTSNWHWRATIPPNNSECFYNVPVGAYYYGVKIPNASNYRLRRQDVVKGNVLIEKCKTKNDTITIVK